MAIVHDSVKWRRRRYLFGSNNITYNATNDKIEQISRARLPENPEVTQTYNFLFIMKLQLQLQFYLKAHKETNTEKNKVTTY